MDKDKEKRLEEAGWHIGTVAEFLDLTDEQMEEIEKRLQEEKLNRDTNQDKLT